MVSTRIYRQDGDLIIERSALGQVVEYGVYRVAEDGRRTYIDSGSKRHATNVFNREVRKRGA